EYMGQPVTKSTAPAIAEALRDSYARDGFARPGYKVIDTGQHSGIVRIRLVELTISRVELSGSTGPYEQRVRELANALPERAAVRPDDIRDVLRQVRGLPGLTVEADTYTDASGNGAMVADLDAEYQPLEASLKLSNRGTQEIGRNLAFAQASANGLFGLRSSAGLYAGTTEETDKYRSGGLFGMVTAGPHGTSGRLVAGVSALRLPAADGTEAQDRTLVNLRVTQPLHQEGSRILSVWSEVELEDLDVALDDTVLREDRLRSLAVGASLGFRKNASQYSASLQLEQGLTALGGGVHTVGDPDDPRRADFTIAELRLVDRVELEHGWFARWDVFGQYSPHILPSTKRFKIGGNRIGRGFEAAAISGDRGIGNKLTLTREFDDFADWRRHTALYGFYDLGTTWLEQTADRQSAASAGVGVSFGADWLSGHVEFAKPLTHADEDGNKDAKVFAELVLSF
ncbi:MAG: ShlB/FhaC/HecB family hemolysin secretion/activation protein, partial [Planctomycetaceae bacterium]